MRWILVLTGFLVLMPFRPVHGALISITCTFSKSALSTIDQNRKVKLTLEDQEAMEVVFDDLDSDHPILSFTIGPARTKAGRLDVIRKELGIIWLAQSRELGHVDFWTVFLKQKTALLSRHYANQATTTQWPVGVLSIGTCQ
jgi:hypothetical protein